MDLILIRKYFRQDGIFSSLKDMEGNEVATTLEHAYPSDSDKSSIWIPKVPDGEYLCLRGAHQLKGMNYGFITFEITGVPKHSGILFHTGNRNGDSEGCVLLGQSIVQPINSPWWVRNSIYTFKRFMSLQEEDQFLLIVKSSS